RHRRRRAECGGQVRGVGRGKAVGGVEQDLLQLAGQVAVPDQGGGGGQRVAGDADPAHVAGAGRAGQLGHAGRGPGDGGRAGQHRGGPAGGRGESERHRQRVPHRRGGGGRTPGGGAAGDAP